MKRRFNLKLSGAMFHRNKVAKTGFVPLRVLRIQALLCSSSEWSVSRKSRKLFGPEKMFLLAVFISKIKVLIVLKVIQRSYHQFMEQNGLVWDLGPALVSVRLQF